MAQDISTLLAALRVDPLPGYTQDKDEIDDTDENENVDEIVEAVDFAVFNPKAGLMKNFRKEVETLGNLVHRDTLP